jgi:C-terminal processing protease CtpA/Prc
MVVMVACVLGGQPSVSRIRQTRWSIIQEEDIVITRIVGGVAIVATLSGLLVFATLAAAQGRGRTAPDALVLEGLGSVIGVSIRDLTPAETTGDASRGGVFIDEVVEGTPAAQAGFTQGDIVVEFDGERIRSARQFTRLVRETPPGRAVTVAVVRGGSRETVNVTPEARTAGSLVPGLADRIERSLRRLPRDLNFDFDFDVQGNRTVIGPRGRLGATLTSLSPQLAEYFGVKEGLLVASVEPDSSAARAGLRAGDVITAAGGTAVRTASDVTRALRQAQPGATTELRVMREKKELTLSVTAPERPAPRAPRIRTRGVTA